MRKSGIGDAEKKKQALENNLQMLEAHITQDRSEITDLIADKADIDSLRAGLSEIQGILAQGRTDEAQAVIAKQVLPALDRLEAFRARSRKLIDEIAFFEREYFETIRRACGIERFTQDETAALQRIRSSIRPHQN